MLQLKTKHGRNLLARVDRLILLLIVPIFFPGLDHGLLGRHSLLSEFLKPPPNVCIDAVVDLGLWFGRGLRLPSSGDCRLEQIVRWGVLLLLHPTRSGGRLEILLPPLALGLVHLAMC